MYKMITSCLKNIIRWLGVQGHEKIGCKLPKCHKILISNDKEHTGFSSSKVVQRFELSHEGVPIGLTTGILNAPDRSTSL